MNAKPPDPKPEPEVMPDPAWALQPREDTLRIHWLFRDALRQREIHPLMRLVQMHRQCRSA